MNYLYIFLTIILTVYAQIVIKWQVLQAGDLPITFEEKIRFIFYLLLNPWIISAFLAAFIASMSWMAAMTKFELSQAYPLFISLTFVMILVLSAFSFHEPITPLKIIGMVCIILGIIIGSQ